MSAEVTIKFDEAKIAAAIAGATADGLNGAAVVLVGAMRKNFGSEGGGVVGKQKWKYKQAPGGAYALRKDGSRARVRSNRNRYAPAAPGHYPGVRTGRLRNSTAYDPATPDNLVAHVGTNLAYGRWLELGHLGRGNTSDNPKLARPWARRSLEAAAGDLREAFANRFRSSLRARLGH